MKVIIKLKKFFKILVISNNNYEITKYLKQVIFNFKKKLYIYF